MKNVKIHTFDSVGTSRSIDPYTLTVEKAGYQAYVKKFVLSGKVTWEIKVARANSILFNSGRPVLNIESSDPENKNVVVF
jgi:hypothetical protein